MQDFSDFYTDIFEIRCTGKTSKPPPTAIKNSLLQIVDSTARSGSNRVSFSITVCQAASHKRDSFGVVRSTFLNCLSFDHEGNAKRRPIALCAKLCQNGIGAFTLFFVYLIVISVISYLDLETLRAFLNV